LYISKIFESRHFIGDAGEIFRMNFRHNFSSFFTPFIASNKLISGCFDQVVEKEGSKQHEVLTT